MFPPLDFRERPCDADSVNVDHILATLNVQEVEFLLIGGINFMLRHRPILTFDVDVWIRDTAENRARCESALALLGAEWGASESDWGPVSRMRPGWMTRQPLFAFSTTYGALDVFRHLAGLDDWDAAHARALPGRTADGTSFLGLSDRDMLACQEALPEHERKMERINILRQQLGSEPIP